MKQKLILGVVCAMSLSMLAACGGATETTDADTQTQTQTQTEESTEAEETAATEDTIDAAEISLETYTGDGWTLQYDPDQITAAAGDDGSVTFAYYSEDFTNAGSDYSIISRHTDTDYKTVLADMQKSYGAEDAEMIESYYGADGVEAYSFTKLFEAAEGSELQTNVSCTAIPVDSDVILIENYTTIEPKDEDQMRIDAAFETLLGTFFLTDANASATEGYKTYEFDTYDGTTVVIDDSNIVSQEANEDALEWEELPEDAEQLAPGRDCILFSSGDNYYVEDAANGLVTIATK